ncbi:OPT family oligopeptide transporter [Auritidibacter sp. NML130574]|uniref:OPT/YSL family transporter n=1 Tax=Auritidibacter sp. NML130574 TaxID=2170745 RepID=UPI000D73B4B3|nr:OPT/YSL family transporter [Auritidibacter sp. NML130574]AXR73566.1 OPT family oligopeptide transporter [Auritidibacter sp. NML130574]
MTTKTAGDVVSAHPRAFEASTVILSAVLSLVGAVIGVHLITAVGISANTSVIGAVIALLIGRFSYLKLSRFRHPHRQNLVQSAISSATFAASNGLIAPIAIPYALGEPHLVQPMLIGCALGVLIDVFILYRAFGSRFMPASAPWPPGVAAAETIRAGIRGGRRAVILLAGGIIGLGGSFLSLPMSAGGVALIGNFWALLMFGIGLLLAQYSPILWDIDLNELYVAHGVMIGAGVVALLQVLWIIVGARTKRAQLNERTRLEAVARDETLQYTTDNKQLGRSLALGYALFVLGALLIALIGGVVNDLPFWGLVGFVLFAGMAAIVHELIVGLAAMHAGWFPAFAVTLIFLIFGLLLEIPVVPLVMLVAYCSATGPAFADMGYDYKAGWILRRASRPWKDYELSGRREQLKISIVAILVAVGVVALTSQSLFADDRIPPSSQVFADTITAGVTDPQIASTMALWAIPGALIQLFGGSKRQMGVLFATGLLVATPNAGWVVLVALALRLVWRKYRGAEGEHDLALVGAGVIAADSLYNVGKIIRI